MAESSVETLKSAVQALYRVHAVEGPPGENGLRTVWHLCPRGAELMSLVDAEGRVRRQELTLLEDHYVWSSGEGVRTGSLERGRDGRTSTAAVVVVQTDPELVPQRLMRAALAMGTYTGQDRYLLHMQRVLALAREGLEMKGGLQRPSEPTLPTVESPSETAQAVFDVPPTAGVVQDVPPPVVRPAEGMTMVLVLAVGLVVGLGMLAFIMMG